MEDFPGDSLVDAAPSPVDTRPPPEARFRSKSPNPAALVRHGSGRSLSRSSASASSLARPRTAGATRSRRKQLKQAMRARQERRAPPSQRRLLKINVQNVRPAHAYTLVEQVEHSPHKFAHLATNRRFARMAKSQSTDAQYNTSVKTLAGKVGRASNYLKFRKKKPEKPDPPVFADLEYNTDTAHKATIATSVYRAPRTYPGMRVGGARFKVPQRLIDERDIGPGYVDVPLENPTRPRVRAPTINPSAAERFQDKPATGGADVYDPDAGVKATLATQVATSARRFSPMSSPTPRGIGVAPRERHLVEALRNIDSNAHEHHSLATLVQKAPNKYRRAFDPDMPRFSTDDELGRDKEVARIMRDMIPAIPDTGPQATLATAVEQSERRYSPMTSPTPRFVDPAKKLTTNRRLGPGAFNPAHSLTDKSPYYPNMNQSRARRFANQQESYKANGSYYSGEREAKAWVRSGKTLGFVSKSPQRSPVENRNMLDKVYDLDSGIKASLSTAVMASPRNPHISYRSKVPRSTTAHVSSCPPSLGPGSFSPVVLHHGKGAQLATEPLSPRKAPVPTSSRFAVTAKLDFSMLSGRGGFPGGSATSARGGSARGGKRRAASSKTLGQKASRKKV